MARLIDLTGLSRFLAKLKEWMPIRPGGGTKSAVGGNGNGASASNIKASGSGSFAFGDAFSSIGNITASGAGSAAGGSVIDGNIVASGAASRAIGHIDSDGGGITASGDGARAEGYVNGGSIIASGTGSFAKGSASDNNIKAEFAGAMAHGFAFTGDIIAFAAGSHAEGYADGENITASGKGSHAEGVSTIAQNEGEHAQGTWNKSNKASNSYGNAGNTIMSVGIGEDGFDRRNAFEIMQNGDTYLNGVGSYIGTNPSTSNTLQTVINAKAPLASPALTGTPTAPTATAGTNTTQIATTAFVKTEIDNLPEPMIFKGSLGTGGTITSLPTASASNEGYTYKVITAGTYASQAAKVGDTFISTGSEWVLIPSGDEPSGTVTSVATGTGLTGGPVTSSGTISHADTSSQASVSNSGRTYIQSVTLDGMGHVTGLSSATETVVNSDSYVNAAAFADDSTNSSSPVKMSLTRIGTTPSTIVGNIPKVSSTSAGVVPKGASVSTQSQTTKFLREDGSWAAPSYTTVSYPVTSVNSKTGAVSLTYSDVGAAASSHTHNYAGSSSAGGAATSANKINTDAGSATQPVYFSSGVPVAISYTIEKSVPSNAVFTDTTYESKAAASGGTDVSLCTTGEKYTWNNKSNLAIGTTATTAAAGNHTHTTTLATDTGTSSITLANGGKYKLTAGGTSVIFTMPAGASSDVYWATYGTSTYSEVATAISNNKVVLLKWADDHSVDHIMMATFAGDEMEGITFSNFEGNYYTYTYLSEDGWDSVYSSGSLNDFQRTTYRASSITSSNKSSTTYYASTQAVYDYVGRNAAGKYSCTKSSGSGVTSLFCCNGNLVCYGASTSFSGTFAMTVSNFYAAFMKSIGGYTLEKEALSDANKISELAYLMTNSSITKLAAGSGSNTRSQFSYQSINGSTGTPVSFTYGASSSGNRITVSSSGVTLTIV